MSWSLGSDSLDDVEYLPLWITKCGECIHRRKTWLGKKPTFAADFLCAYNGGREVKPDDFCSRGERVDEA